MAAKKLIISPEWYGSTVSVFTGSVVRAIVLSDKTSAEDIKLLATINHPSLTTDNDTE
jgi:hypothetical protein